MTAGRHGAKATFNPLIRDQKTCFFRYACCCSPRGSGYTFTGEVHAKVDDDTDLADDRSRSGGSALCTVSRDGPQHAEVLGRGGQTRTDQQRELQADAAVSIAPAANRTASINGAGVDLRGYESGSGVFHFGAITDGGWTPSIEESDDNAAFTAVAAKDQVGTATEALAANDDTIQVLKYIGNKRYIRCVMTESTASTTGALFSALVVRGRPEFAPVP